MKRERRAVVLLPLIVELADTTLLWEKKLDRFNDDKPCTLTGQ